MALLSDQPDPPRVLIVEGDDDAASRMAEALQAPGAEHDLQASEAVVVIDTLSALHAQDLSPFNILVCAISLPDGSGLDALAYIRGMRPQLPVILIGSASDADIAVEAIRAGAIDVLIRSRSDLRTLPLDIEKGLAHHRIKMENERLQRDHSRSLAELAIKNHQLQQMIYQLEAMTRTDDLTQLCNRRWFNETYERIWAEALRNDRPLAFLMIDLDHFKDINDTLGHQRGDDILQLTGKVIEANCRGVDVAARYGGDEFCLLLPQTEADDAINVARRILREFAIATQDEGKASVSIGIAHTHLTRPVNASQLISQADEALYAAKSGGKGRVMLRTETGIVDRTVETSHQSAKNPG